MNCNAKARIIGRRVTPVGWYLVDIELESLGRVGRFYG